MSSNENKQGKSGFVAIVGRPNAGKSTLLNAVLGSEVSIVTPKAQTTRDKVLGILTEKEGQIVFIDTPGIHRAKEGGINAFMMTEVTGALDAPSAVWYLVDPDSALKHEQAVIDLLKNTVVQDKIPLIVMITKMDVIGKAKNKLVHERLNAFEKDLQDKLQAEGLALCKTLRISARAGEGVKDLLALTWSLMQEGPRYYEDEDQVSDKPMRFFVAEKIREQLLMCLGDEVPYSCAVKIDSYEEGASLDKIQSTIYVERDSQKGIVIGKGGLKIKEIGQKAREKIELFVGKKVFLGLQVKVLKDWSKDAEALKQMGYHLPEKK